MSSTFQFLPSTPWGRLVHWLSRGRLCRFPEEMPGFQLPSGHPMLASSQNSDLGPEIHKEIGNDDRHSVNDSEFSIPTGPPATGLHPEATQDSTIVVSWYNPEDQGNPHCWPTSVKFMVYLQINVYTFVVYMASSIFSVAEPDFIDNYGVPTSLGSLGLALVLLGYGLGALFFSPLSEVPAIGRNPPYVISTAVFVLVSGVVLAVDNAPGFLVLRFLQGFFGSPALATGAASLTDITEIVNIPYGLWFWGTCAVAAPAIAPCIAGFSIVNGWKWSMWEILWGAAPCMISLLFLPETFTPTILYQRAKRLRALTGNQSFRAASEIDDTKYSARSLVHRALITPWKINAQDPAILFTTVYTTLVYAIFYSFFEVFPLVYQEIYHMSTAHMSLVFLTAIIGVFLVAPFYLLFIYYFIAGPIHKGNFPAPERRLIPALFISLFFPTGMYLFAWTSRPDIHWTVPTLGFMFIMMGVIVLLQCMFGYMAVAYPNYSASLFAMNDFARSTLAFAAIMWSGPLYRNLGVGRGTSLIGAFTVPCVFGIFALYKFGPELRRRSRFAG